MNTRLVFAFMLFALSFPVRFAHAQMEGSYTVSISKKAEEKKNARWTLADWLSQKDRTKSMNFWLAQNSTASPFEFYIEGRSLKYDATISPSTSPIKKELTGGALGVYAGVVGLRGSFEEDGEKRTRSDGSLNLRIFGRQLQDTHINLQYGVQGLEMTTTKEKYQNQFAGVQTNIYLTKFFGLSGSYQNIISAESNLHNEMEGERSTAGVFIDFAAIRLFGEWRKENLWFKDSSGLSSSSESRDGAGFGLQIYF